MEERGATTALAAPPPLPPKTRRSASSVTTSTAPATASVATAPGATGLVGGVLSVGGGSTQPLSSISSSGEHVVKIRINPDASAAQTGSIRISVGRSDPEDMVRRPTDSFIKQPHSNPYFFCSTGMVSSGQSSPSDTLDSGTCSDLDGSTPPPLPKKNGVSAAAAAAAAVAAAATVTVTVNGTHPQHRRTGSLTSSGAEADSDEDAHSNISCDSLNGHELNGINALNNGLNGGGDIEENSMQYSFANMVLTNGHHKNHGETIMESIQEEKIISPPSPTLKSVALTVRANNLVNNPMTAPVAPMIAATAATVVAANASAAAVNTSAAIKGNTNIVTFNGSANNSPVSTAPIITNGTPKPPPPKTPAKPFKAPKTPTSPSTQKTFLPQGLLQDIRDRTATLTGISTPGSPGRKLRTWGGDTTPPKTEPKSPSPEPKEIQKNQSSLYRILSSEHATDSSSPKSTGGIVQERTYEERARERSSNQQDAFPMPPGRQRSGSYKYEEDRYYQFHLNEREPDPADPAAAARAQEEDEEETFAGLKDIMGAKEGSATIRSAKGTVRGVKNRVRAGIATFLHYPDTKNYKEKEAGKVVLYVTTMGIVRHTFQECLKIKKILRTLLVKYEERDAFMSREVQNELRERMHTDQIQVPQLFVEGQHIGDAETIERLNETGELRKMLKPFKSPDVCNTCQVCGGFRLLPCSICNGSKKSMHRNDFTAEFVALKCMSCDEVGLVKCHAC